MFKCLRRIMLRFPFYDCPKFTLADAVLTLLLSSFSVVTRLWKVQHPDCTVFDETYFGNFTNWYTQSRYFLDIHPPLGKLILFLFANFSQYSGTVNFALVPDHPHSDPDYVILRITPAVFGSLCSPLIYLSMRFSSFSKSAAFLSAFFVATDTSFLTEHRLILSDGLLHFFCCLFICFFSFLCTIFPGRREFAPGLVAAGVLLGCACSCKQTAWGLILFAGYTEAFQLLQVFDRIGAHFVDQLVYRGIMLLGLTVAVHFVAYGIHIWLLPFSGPHTAIVPLELQDQLVRSTVVETQLLAKRSSGPGLIRRTVLLSAFMYMGNMDIRDFHPFQSRPINWPLLTGICVAFWAQGKDIIGCLGNALVYYPAFFGLFLVLLAFRKKRWEIGMRFVVGWAVCYFPFFLIPRPMYLYHYLIPLVFACMAAGAAADLWMKPAVRGIVVVAVCGGALIGFCLWSPIAYGTPHLDDEVTFWTDRWMSGDEYHKRLAEKNPPPS
jgi:dolichyl-phosphate-mannose--protein O-mannosyl transferase